MLQITLLYMVASALILGTKVSAGASCDLQRFMPLTVLIQDVAQPACDNGQSMGSTAVQLDWIKAWVLNATRYPDILLDSIPLPPADKIAILLDGLSCITPGNYCWKYKRTMAVACIFSQLAKAMELYDGWVTTNCDLLVVQLVEHFDIKLKPHIVNIISTLKSIDEVKSNETRSTETKT